MTPIIQNWNQLVHELIAWNRLGKDIVTAQECA